VHLTTSRTPRASSAVLFAAGSVLVFDSPMSSVDLLLNAMKVGPTFPCRSAHEAQFKIGGVEGGGDVGSVHWRVYTLLKNDMRLGICLSIFARSAAGMRSG
jgi:hypothetical protein